MLQSFDIHVHEIYSLSFSKTEYDCEDATCISASLRCNGVKNCKFGWDEESCGDITGDFMKLFAKTHVVSIIVVLFFIMVGMIAGTLCGLWNLLLLC